MPLPLIKLGSLFIKTLSKPLANAIKRNVKTSPSLSKAIITPAQGYHRLEQTVRMSLMGWKKKVEVKPLSDDAAVTLGSELLGEFIIFGAALGTLLFEYKRSQYKDKRKEQVQNEKIASLQEQVNKFGSELKIQTMKQIELGKQIELLQLLQVESSNEKS